MNKTSPVITLLTDFSDHGGYVGTMKGVMQNIVPQASFIDITHQIEPQDIQQAAFILMTSVPFFPSGTVHLVVVDPGVGSNRIPIAVRTERYSFVSPDNGVLSFALPESMPYQAVALVNPNYQLSEVSQTFHGRDVFAPAAGHLAAGIEISQLGPPVDKIVRLPPPKLVISERKVTGEVLIADRFGNLSTSIHSLRWEQPDILKLRPSWGLGAGEKELRFRAAEAKVQGGALRFKGISETYTSVEPGEVVAYVGSGKALEIAINRGNLQHTYDLERGVEVSLLVENV